MLVKQGDVLNLAKVNREKFQEFFAQGRSNYAQTTFHAPSQP